MRRTEVLFAIESAVERSPLGAWLRRRMLRGLTPPPYRGGSGGGLAGVREPRRPSPAPLVGGAVAPLD